MGASVQSFNIKPNAKWLEKCPHFLNEIPEWHAKLFQDSEKIYEPHPEQFLRDTLQSIRQVSRYMSVYRLLLLLFPYPRLVQRRNQFKGAITDAIRLNGFKVKDSRGNSVTADALFSLEYFHDCAYVYVDLESLEDAARRGWLNSDGLYVCIWRRYVEEKEARFQQDFTEYENHQGSFLPTKSDTQATNKRPSTLDKMQERLDIYNQVVEEMGAGTHKNVLLREAAKRAGCGIDSIKRALGEKD